MKKFAFVFPGQGSQSVGMLNAWGDHPAIVSTLAEASDALGEDIRALIANGPAEALAQTRNTQPVMLAAGVACFRAWQAEGGATPGMLAGHSLGEYSALVVAGVLTLAQAAPLVRFRAEAMQQAVPAGEGAMAAILGLSATEIIAACADIQRAEGTFDAKNSPDLAASGTAGISGLLGVVQAVNFNDPLQTVIAGNRAAVEKACEVLKALGARRTLMLPVSAPFHSSLMQPAAEKLRERLASMAFAAPQIPFVNNVDVAIESEPELIKDALVRQAASPVRWVECIQALQAQGYPLVVECGPGKVLAGLVKRINAGMTGHAWFDPSTLTTTQELLA